MDPLECWDADIDVFRRERIAAGFRSPGEYVRVARMLLDEIGSARSDSALGLVAIA